MNNKVTFILDRKYLGNLKSIALENHVWIIGSEYNLKLAEAFWEEKLEIKYPDQGVTTTKDGSDLLNLFYQYLDEIDLHHNSYSTDKPREIIEIVGIKIQDVDVNIIKECIDDNTLVLIKAENGFNIKKSAQQVDAPETGSNE